MKQRQDKKQKSGKGLEETQLLYAFLENYADEHNFKQMADALVFTVRHHEGQFRSRNKKTPYVYHPMMVALMAITIGFEEEDILSASLLHDVVEDCDVDLSELPVGENSRKIVKLLTRDRENGQTEEGKQAYYSAIAEYPPAVIVKLLDRISNLSDMAAGFSDQKMIYYLQETHKWIYPYFEKAEEYYPEKKAYLKVMKYHMDSIGRFVERLDKKQDGPKDSKS